jgi:DNA polymerase
MVGAQAAPAAHGGHHLIADMSSLRNAYLDVLGIDRWVPRDAVDERAETVELPAPPAAVTGTPPATASVVATAPAARDRPVSRYERGPLATDWVGLRAQVAGCTACDQLCKTRTQTVFGVGNTQAEWLVIGEAPGAEEDRQGEPFVGRAGQLLNAMLLAIGLPRETVFIANVLKCRPPGNRDPRPEEVSNCLPFLSRQIALLKPKIMLAVGRIAAQNLLATDAPLARLRGKLHRFGEADTPLVITYHPAYLLRTPADKRKAWEDLKFARASYARLAGGPT